MPERGVFQSHIADGASIDISGTATPPGSLPKHWDDAAPVVARLRRLPPATFRHASGVLHVMMSKSAKQKRGIYCEIREFRRLRL